MISKKRFFVKRLIDDTFGKFLFTAFSLRKKKDYPKKVDKIVILKLSTIGDSLLALPAIKSLKEETNAKIILVHSGDNKVIFENQPFFDEKIILDVSKNNPFELIKSIMRIKKINADVAVDLSHTGHLSGIFSLLSGKYVGGFFNPEVPKRKDFYDFEFPIGKEHMVKNYFGIFSKVNNKNKITNYNLIRPTLKEKNKKMESFLKGKKNLVGVHPCHEIKEKSWEKENFAKIIDYLIKNGKTPVILGSPKENTEVRKLIQLIKNKDKVINLSGKLNIPEIFLLMPYLDFFVSNDGGLMHIAASFNLPTLGIFTAETPKKYAPYNAKSYAIDARFISKEESLKTAKNVIDEFLNLRKESKK